MQKVVDLFIVSIVKSALELQNMIVANSIIQESEIQIIKVKQKSYKEYREEILHNISLEDLLSKQKGTKKYNEFLKFYYNHFMNNPLYEKESTESKDKNIIQEHLKSLKICSQSEKDIKTCLAFQDYSEYKINIIFNNTSFCPDGKLNRVQEFLNNNEKNNEHKGFFEMYQSLLKSFRFTGEITLLQKEIKDITLILENTINAHNRKDILLESQEIDKCLKIVMYINDRSLGRYLKQDEKTKVDEYIKKVGQKNVTKYMKSIQGKTLKDILQNKEGLLTIILGWFGIKTKEKKIKSFRELFSNRQTSNLLSK